MNFCQVDVCQHTKNMIKKQKNKVEVGLKLSNAGSAVATVLSLWPVQASACQALSGFDMYN